jgi:hypothetical protein
VAFGLLMIVPLASIVIAINRIPKPYPNLERLESKKFTSGSLSSQWVIRSYSKDITPDPYEMVCDWYQQKGCWDYTGPTLDYAVGPYNAGVIEMYELVLIYRCHDVKATCVTTARWIGIRLTGFFGL